MLNEKELHIIREQLTRMIEFMSKTPDGKNDPLWWYGDMPASCNFYIPSEWQTENRPIWMVWQDYLSELEHANLHEYRALADKLDVADLLATSEKESKRC